MSRDGSAAVVPQLLEIFRWTESGGLEPIASPSGSEVIVSGISHNGTRIVGTIDQVPVILDVSLVPMLLEVGAAGYSAGFGTSISGDGSTVVGTMYGTGSTEWAFRWTTSTGVVDITPALHVRSKPRGLALDGAVVMDSGRRPGPAMHQTGFV